jgi:hypothetical protein
VMFVTPNELTIKYQLWSLLSGKCHLESSALVRNGLPNSNFQEHHASRRSDHLVSDLVFLDRKLHHLLRMNQFQMSWDMTLPIVPVQTLQQSFASSLPQRTCSLGLNKYLACRGLIPGGLCCKEMMVVDLVLGGLVPYWA